MSGSRHSDRARWIVPGIVVAAGLLAPILYLAARGLLFTASPPPSRSESADSSESSAETERIEATAPGVRPVTLYFSDTLGVALVPERREVAIVPSETEFATGILSELILGSARGHAPTIPPATRLRAVYLDDAGTLYVDFSRELIDDHPGGTGGELLTVHSLVETVAANLPHVRRLRLLVEGAEPASLTGHVALSAELALPGRGT